MDDILQRMLEVEKDAEALVKEKSADCQKLLENARTEALQEISAAQKTLNEECNAQRTKILADAEEERKRRLEDSNSQLSAKLNAFQQKIQENYPEILCCLAGEK